MTELQLFYDSGLFTYVVLPLLIFLARICDVTIGTLRIVMVAKGQKFWAPSWDSSKCLSGSSP